MRAEAPGNDVVCFGSLIDFRYSAMQSPAKIAPFLTEVIRPLLVSRTANRCDTTVYSPAMQL
jgi:hypothetical protein